MHTLIWQVISFVEIQINNSAFTMDPTFAVLFFGPRYNGTDVDSNGNHYEKPTTVTNPAQARFFRTDVVQEYNFMSFMSRLYALEMLNRYFTLISGMGLVLFIFRILKSLNFQERMGLVTRTLAIAFNDLWHFFLLCKIHTQQTSHYYRIEMMPFMRR